LRWEQDSLSADCWVFYLPPAKALKHGKKFNRKVKQGKEKLEEELSKVNGKPEEVV
jgi:hypothetical protein